MLLNDVKWLYARYNWAACNVLLFLLIECIGTGPFDYAVFAQKTNGVMNVLELVLFDYAVLVQKTDGIEVQLISLTLIER